MNRLPLSSPCLLCYLLDHSLLLFSEKTGNVYGLEKESAALFLEIDTLAASHSKNEIIRQFAQLSEDLISHMFSVATCEETDTDHSYSPPLDVGIYLREKKKRMSYSLQGLTFAVHYQKAFLKDFIHPPLHHLHVPFENEKIINVDFKPIEKLWQIYFNNAQVGSPVPAESLFPVLLEYMLIAYAESVPFLISMHAAAVGTGQCVFIMPAQSGSGKSTLTAALMAEGFELYSDEMVQLDSAGRVSFFPFPLNIKEGSWGILEKRFPLLGDQSFHRRFDGQKLRFIPPQNSPSSKKKATHLIFPKYIEGTSVVLREVSACEAMIRIKEGGYKLQDPLDQESFEQIIENVISLPKFSLEYSSLDDAVNTIKKLCHADS